MADVVTAVGEGAAVRLFDCHAMIGRIPGRDVGEGTVAALTKAMDRVGIDAAVVGHTAAWRHDPAARRHGVTAVRLYPVDHGYGLSGPDCAPLLDALAAARLPTR